MAMKEEWSMGELTETLNKTAETDKDNFIGVDGSTGVGKSTLSIKACKSGCPWFDIRRDILYSRKEILEWVTTAKPGSFGTADEMINAMFKRDFAARNQKFLLKVFDMCRDRNLTLFMCIPNFWALDKHLLEGRIRLRIHVAKTGFAFMWKPSSNPFAPDRWYRKYNEKVSYNWDLYPNAKKTKGFIGYLKFGDLGIREKEEYLKIKAKKKAMVAKEEEETEKKEIEENKKSVELGKLWVLNFLNKKGLLRPGWQVAIASDEGITPAGVNKRLKELEEKKKLSEPLLNQVNLDNLYNINNNNDDLQEI